jgi:hypothetical protein
MRTNSWAKNTELGRVAAPSAMAELATTVEADEIALAKYGLCMLDMPGRKLLNKHRLREGAASLELIRRRLQLSRLFITHVPRLAVPIAALSTNGKLSIRSSSSALATNRVPGCGRSNSDSSRLNPILL